MPIASLGRLIRRVDVIVWSSTAAERVRQLADPALQVMIDDRALDERGIEMLAVLLVRQNGAETAATPPTAQKRRSDRRRPPQGASRAAGRNK